MTGADYGWQILKTCLITAFVILVIKGLAIHDAELETMRATLKLHGIDVPVKVAGQQ